MASKKDLMLLDFYTQNACLRSLMLWTERNIQILWLPRFGNLGGSTWKDVQQERHPSSTFGVETEVGAPFWE